jgi:hypothetical protein
LIKEKESRDIMDLDKKIQEYNKKLFYKEKAQVMYTFLKQGLIEETKSTKQPDFQKVEELDIDIFGYELYQVNEKEEYALVKYVYEGLENHYVYCVLDFSEQDKILELYHLALEYGNNEVKQSNRLITISQFMSLIPVIAGLFTGILFLEESIILGILVIFLGIAFTVLFVGLTEILKRINRIENKL